MSKRGYGKRIKRSKNLYKKKKSGFRKVVELLIMAVLVVGLSFVGFTIGKTIWDYDPTPTDDVPADNTPTDSSSEGQDTDTDSPDSTPADTEEEPPDAYAPTGSAVYAPSNVLTNSASLSSYLETAKSQGFDAVVLELKDSEGRLLYKSNIEVLSETDIVSGTLTAEQIASACTAAGIRPIARINTLMDRLAPSKIKEVSYRFADGSVSWMDASPENGGKFWANPFLSGTKTYISTITDELYNAGFDDIIYVNTIFPNFTSYDVSVLSGDITNEKTRYSALADLVNYAAENSPGVNIILEISLNDIIGGDGLVKTAEVLRGTVTAAGAVLVFTQLDSQTTATGGNSQQPENVSDLVKTAFGKAEGQTGGLNIIPCIDGSAFSESDREKIITAFSEMGYESYMSRN